MAHITVSGEIIADRLYFVADASVVYNSATYTSGQFFTGASGVKTFTYSGSGVQALYEVLELIGSAVEYTESSIDQPSYADKTKITGFAIEFALNDAEKTVKEVTKIIGFAIELLDYPFYSFEITESKL